MEFQRVESSLASLIECYWQAESSETVPVCTKIIPDGFPEIIFHYRDPYRIRLANDWTVQPMQLFGGQLKQFFSLENTGASGMFGIKLKPAAPSHLFKLHMHLYTHRVVDLSEAVGTQMNELIALLQSCRQMEERVAVTENYFQSCLLTLKRHESIDQAVDFIRTSGGHITVSELSDRLHMGERQVERIFKTHVGLSPKLYARIIRFSKIFSLLEQNDPSWMDLMYQAGYYDQSHLIRNFKAFTGEDPSKYNFSEKNMANFFLMKS